MENFPINLVMLAGLPGAGKTTLAYALERELGWRLIDKDRYRVDLLNEGMDRDRAANIAYEHSFHEIRTALIEQHTSVIFDTAAIYHFILDTVRDIVSCVVDARLKVLLCVVDRDLRNERLRSRGEQHTRITVDPITIADYLQYFDHLPEDKLIIYTNVPIKEYLSEVKKYVLS